MPHTPGRWIVDDRHVHCQDGLTYPHGQEPETDIIVEVNTDCHDNGLLNETDKANLQLIAAAPDLLAACNMALRFFESPGFVDMKERFVPVNGEAAQVRAMQRTVANRIEDLRAAIAKTTNES